MLDVVFQNSFLLIQNCSKELEDWAGKIIPLIGGLGCAMFILAVRSAFRYSSISKFVCLSTSLNPNYFLTSKLI